jgi:hypothetical protein
MLTVAQLVKNFPTVYGPQRFIAVFTGPNPDPDAPRHLVVCPIHNSSSVHLILPDFITLISVEGRDSSVGIALGHGLEDRGSGVRFSAGG